MSRDICEVRHGRGWRSVEIEEALADYKNEEKRCPECHGPMRAHSSETGVPRPHFEHLQAHIGCSRSGRRFSGKPSEHPHALD